MVIVSVACASPEDVDTAVRYARAAFPGWRKTSHRKRCKIMLRLASLIEEATEELASLESIDNGMNFLMAQAVVRNAAASVRYFAGWIDKIHGETFQDQRTFMYTLKEPLGVCAGVLPFNYPFFLACSKLAPALATGNTMILKPSEKTPLTTLRLGSLCREAGVPKGVVAVLPGLGDVGARLASHPDVDKISFTGSVPTGKKIMRAAADSNLKRVSLELGGKSPHIVFADAKVDKAVALAHSGLFTHQGQVCVAGSRVFVQRPIYDEFVRKSALRAEKRAVGDPFDPQIRTGPIVDEAQFKKVIHFIASGQQQGARLVTGGARVGDKGFFLAPTIFADVTDEMRIAREEIFGPVMCIIPFDTVDEVVERANNTMFGLAAGVVTNNLRIAHRMASALAAGTVWVNTYGVLDERVPFGGYKQSGMGREGGEHVLKEYLNVKTVQMSML